MYCLSETHPANTAAVTVELLFVLVIVQLTLVAKILKWNPQIITSLWRRWRWWCYLPEDRPTLRAGLLYLLPEAAVAALDLLDVVPPEGVVDRKL